MNWLIDRMKEKSTWLAIFTLIGLFGIRIEPELRDTIINAILAVAAVAAFVFKETLPDEVVKPPIELQSRNGLDRVLSVPGVVDSPDPDRRKSERVQIAMQSPVGVKNYRNIDPEPPVAGFNDQ